VESVDGHSNRNETFALAGPPLWHQSLGSTIRNTDVMRGCSGGTKQRLATMGRVAALVATLTGLGGCDRHEPTGQPPAVDPGAENLGTVGLALTLSSNVSVSVVDYSITGNGITPRTGPINVADPGATPSLQVGGVPAGAGYLVTLTATSTDGQTMCNGSGMVDVVANQVSLITVIMQCRATGTTGVVNVGGGFNNCPVVTSYSGSPATVSVGGSITVSVSATDPDGDALMFGWTSGSGSFGDRGAPVTSFTCTASGPVTLTMTITDGQCQSGIALPISCVPFCQARANGTPCDDGNACTRADSCLAGACVGADPVTCAALDQCHDKGTCDPATGTCSNPNAANGKSCNDGDACTRVDQCANGACVGGSAVMCVAQDQCHAPGMCASQSGLCSNPPVADGTACSLQNANASCTGGACGVVSCSAGYGDCDLVASTGCEVSLLTSAANCGMCGRACSAGSTCGAGLCIAAPPTGLSAVAGGWKVQLAWSGVPDATSYTVLRAAAGSGTLQPIGTSISAQFLDDAVASGVTYTYAVASNSEGGASPPSVTVATTVLEKQVCVSDDDDSIRVFDSAQSGAATPVRTLTAGATGLESPEGLASNLVTGELFVALFGGQISVFPLSASGGPAPVRTLPGAASDSAGPFFLLESDPVNRELVTADQGASRLLVLDDSTGVVKRTVTGAATELAHPLSAMIDGVHGETLVGQLDPTNSFQQILVFGSADTGNQAPKRVLGGTGNTMVGGWAVVYDRVHDEVFSACNCNNLIMVFDRTASGNAAPKRTIQLPGPIVRVSSLMLDTAKDTLWVAGWGGLSKDQLLEIPRSSSGPATPLRTPVSLGLAGNAPRLARCN